MKQGFCLSSSKRLLLMMTAVLLMAALCGAAFAESYTAQTMRLLRYEGDVEITDASGKPRFVMENVRFSSGEAMRTGVNSLASVGLDDSKIVTLDAESRMEFFQQGNSMRLTLAEGSLFLDVQEKLDENESLDIQTSTMTVGIRGTIVFLSVTSAEGIGETATLGVLEGTAQVTYQDADGSRRMLEVPAGQKAVAQRAETGGALDIGALKAEDIAGFVNDQIAQDEQVTQRVAPVLQQIGSPEDGASGNLFPADGDWTWSGEVTLVAQSASKLYDGQPLTRSSDVLVYGLPNQFSIQVSAGGSQTDAGSSSNPIDHYVIYNADGEDVTRHFTQIRTVSGRLTVDPAPLSIWTGSAEKVYDGTPLTCDEAGIRTVPGYVSGEPAWRNTSYVASGALGSQTMYSLSGVTWVHGTNPLTGELQEIRLYAGQKVSIVLHEEDNQQSLEFRVENMAVEDIPEDVLRVYAGNPDLLSQACADTGWDPAAIAQRIAALPAADQAGTEEEADAAENLMNNSVNVRISLDTEITNYNRPLGSDEAQFTPVHLDESISVKATGSRTDVGTSVNTYEIDWGRVNPANYVVQDEDDLGTLTVLPAEKKAQTYDDPVTVTADSVSKVYDGQPLIIGSSTGEKSRAAQTSCGVTVTGLPDGFTFSASVSGSLTNAGTTEIVIDSFLILDPGGQDVTALFTNLTRISGVLTIEPAPLTVTTGSASKAYDGTALTSAEAALTGLVGEETAEAMATGTITDVGTVENTCTIDWGDTNSANYVLTEDLGTLEVTKNSAEITITAASAGKVYDGEALTVNEYVASGLPETLTCIATLSGEQKDAGTGTCSITAYQILDADEKDVTANFTSITTVDGELLVTPAPLTVTTSSASKAYDGSPLISEEATLTGLIGDETAEIEATGTITEVGAAENTYTIHWGETNSANYAVTATPGTLEVTANDTPITITSASATMRYRGGLTLMSDEFTVSGVLPPDFTVEAWPNGMQWEVGSSPNTISGYAIKNQNGDDRTDCFTNITLVEGTLTVDKALVTVTTGSVTKTYDGYPASYSVTYTGFFGSDVSGVSFWPSENQSHPGTYTAGYTVNWLDEGLKDKYDTAFVENLGTLTIEPAPVTVTTNSATKEYDGTPLTDSGAAITGLVGVAGDTVTITATGSVTEVGEADNTYTIDWGTDEASYYTVTEELGTLTVTQNTTSITFTASSASKAYDGTPLTSAGVLHSELPAGFTATAAAAGSQTGVGEGVNAVESYQILNSASEDVTAYFSGIATENGTLTVTTSSAPITITAASASKAFDGTALEDSSFTVTGLPEGHTCTATVTGSQKALGDGDNKVTAYQILDGASQDVTSWFTGISTVDGTLTVTANSSPIVITAPSDTWTYNGMEVALTGGGSIEGKPENVTCVMTPTHPSLLNAGSYTTGVSYYFMDDDIGDVTSCFTSVTVVPGTITITPAALTVTTPSASKAYDGTVLTAPAATVNGLADGESITVTCTGSITNVGSATNGCTIDWGSVNSANYALTETLGELTVEPLQITFDLGGRSVQFNPDAVYFSEGFDASKVAGTYGNGDLAGDAVELVSFSASTGNGTYYFRLHTGDELTLKVEGEGNAPGVFPITGTVTFTTGSASNYSIQFVNTELEVTIEEAIAPIG